MSRSASIILLCEDNQHEAFVRHFLKLSGYNPRIIRVFKSPKGRGSGEQWVLQRYAQEVNALRQAPHITSRVLIVVVDEDTNSTHSRSHSLDEALRRDSLALRAVGERIVHVIPARNIETWIQYLDGHTVNETTAYPKLGNERLCRPMVKALKGMCDLGRLRSPAPPSLKAACTEFASRMP